MRFLSGGLVTVWQHGRDRADWSEIRAYEVLYTPVSLVSEGWGAIGAQFHQFLQDKIEQKKKWADWFLATSNEA